VRERYINFVIDQIEGTTMTNHPQDRGGWTQFGLLRTEMEAQGISWPITREQAVKYYTSVYWKGAGMERLAGLDSIQWRLFCDGIHIGIETACQQLQRLLNVSNLREGRWKDLKTDGVFGDKTETALTAYLRHFGNSAVGREARLEQLLRSETASRYVRICLNDPNQEVFFEGWLNRLKYKPVYEWSVNE
jgi:lysozyme family protein